MESFTIHDVEKPLAELIKKKAKSEGLSINATIKKVLEEYLGMRSQPVERNFSHFKPFCGLWTKDDLNEFERTTSDLRKIDPSDWQ